jgi:phosphate transport system substrate-binding protein
MFTKSPQVRCDAVECCGPPTTLISLGGQLRRTPKSALAFAALIACLVPGFTYAASGAMAEESSLTGAGSTLVAPFEAYWGQEFEKLHGVKVTYAAVGSGSGIAQITARTVDFGASDAPLTSSQASACKECVQIPWALTATGIGFNLGKITKLRLTPEIVAEIYLGKITKWNATPIKKINKGVKLPGEKITVVYRSDGSGDTYAFTDLMSRVSKEWKSKVGNATSVSFPVGVGGNGNSGVTAIVEKTKGAIGYIAASYLYSHGLPAARLKNKAGRYEYPNLENIVEAAAAAKGVPSNLEMHIVNPPKKAKKAYPLSTFTYAIVPKDAPKLGLIKEFIDYALTTGQRFGAALDFAKLPSVILKADENAVSSL